MMTRHLSFCQLLTKRKKAGKAKTAEAVVTANRERRIDTALEKDEEIPVLSVTDKIGNHDTEIDKTPHDTQKIIADN